jgi:hypothetical protein
MTLNSSLTGANYTNSSIPDGSYTARFWCNDTSNNFNTASVAFTINTALPVVNLINPISSTTETNINYNYNVTDSLNIDNCSLILDGSVVAVDTSVNNSGSSETITYTTPVGTHTYFIRCTNSVANSATSGLGVLVITSNTVTPISPGGGSGGGGGGGGTRTIILNVEVPSAISLQEKGIVDIPIKLINNGQTDLKEVNLSAKVLKDSVLSNIKTEFSNNYFETIAYSKTESTNLKVNINSEDISIYEVKIKAISKSPNYTSESTVYINFIGKNASGIEKLILFTENMIVENPECLELKQMIDEAKKYFKEGNYVEAVKKTNEALEACKAYISNPEQATYSTSKGEQQIIIYLSIGVLVAILLAIIFNIYRRRRFKKKFKRNKEDNFEEAEQ